MSQEELAKKVGASRIMIGNYERNENTPSVEVVYKIAKVFNVTVDYLLGQSAFAQYDKEMIKRLENIEELDEPTKQTLFSVIDTFLRDAKARKAYS